MKERNVYPLTLHETQADRLAFIRRFVGHTRLAENGCVEWTGGLTTTGYAACYLRGKTVKAHRVSAMLAGLDVNGNVVCHACDNPKCVNPEHLWVGSHKDNSRDMVRKRRQSTQKIFPEYVADIVQAYRAGTSSRTLANKYGCNPTTIVRAINNYMKGQ